MNFTSHFASVSLSFLTNIKGEIFPNLLNLRIFLALTFKMSISMASYGNLISEITKTLSLEQEIWTPTSALPLQSNGDLIKKLSLSGLHLPWQVHMQKLDLLLSAVPDSSSVSDRTLESPNSQPWMWVKAISLIFVGWFLKKNIFVIFDIKYKIPWYLIFPAYLWDFLFSRGLNMFSVIPSVLRLWKPCVSFRKRPASPPPHTREKLRSFDVFLVYGSVFWRGLVMN